MTPDADLTTGQFSAALTGVEQPLPVDQTDRPVANRETTTLDDEGWMLDENGNQWGYCNGCGEESQAGRDCCADGEVVPHGG